MRTRYPRTPHLPWSPGASSDDVRVADLSGFVGEEVVVTEKLDGENTTLGRTYTHARSLDSAHHASRSWVKAFHGRIAVHIPRGWRVCGENVYARHSIAYDDLPAYFFAFNIWDDEDVCRPWDETTRWCRQVGVPHARVLWRGPFDPHTLRRLSVDIDTCEGFVVRTTRAFSRQAFPRCVAKWVRRGHVTDTSGVHWMHRTITPNGLGPEAVLWTLRSGGLCDADAVLRALDLAPPPAAGPSDLSSLAARLDVERPHAEARLAGILAGAILARSPRPSPMLLPHLRRHLPPGTARAVGRLVTLVDRPTLAVPDDTRRAGLTQLSRSVDLSVLHALSAWWADRRGDLEGAEQVAWSTLHAEDAGLWGPSPLAHLRAGLADVHPDDPLVPTLWDGIVRAYGAGRLRSPEEARALVPSLRAAVRPGGVVVLVGPAGAGKSSFVSEHLGHTMVISLDDLRARGGDRSDQSRNAQVLHQAVNQLRQHLQQGIPTTWDATSLTRRQRALVLDLAHRYRVPTRVVSLLTPEATLRARNGTRTHPVPPGVLDQQLHMVEWPLASAAHRVEDYIEDTLTDASFAGWS